MSGDLPRFMWPIIDAAAALIGDSVKYLGSPDSFGDWFFTVLIKSLLSVLNSSAFTLSFLISTDEPKRF